jgi:diaminopimelate decarboxylase
VNDALYPNDRCEISPAGHLVFDGVDVVELAREYPTPFYLMSENIVRANWARLMAAFAGCPEFKAYYSVKTNYETGVLRTLRELGAGAEISGALDFEAARRAGFRPQDMVFDGPCKTEEDLRQTIGAGIHMVNVECESELQMIDRIAREQGRVVKIGIRVDPVVKNPFYSQLVAGYKAKFGFPIDRCDGVIELARRSKHVELVALHAHIGSQILSPELYVQNLGVMMALAGRLSQSGFRLQEINMGGGFPAQSVRYLRVSRRVKMAGLLQRLGRLERAVPDIGAFGRAITQAFQAGCARWGISPILATEPGRSITSNCGIVVGRVQVLKGHWVFSDISINDVPENMFFTEWRKFYPNKMRAPRTQEIHLSGPTLATHDVVQFNTMAPALEPGDLVAIFDTGAYSITRSNQFTRPRSAAYYVRSNGRIQTLRRRETVEDVLRTQVVKDEPESLRESPALAMAEVRA